MRASDGIKLFGLNNLSIEADIRLIEERYDTDLGHKKLQKASGQGGFYPQFPERLRREAEDMARHYAIFYCLENSIRELIRLRLGEEHGADWWNKAVPPHVVENAQRNRRREMSAGITLRSDEMIDYTTFGELAEIIRANWNVFDDMLQDIKAVERILSGLNMLRAPIAHCKALAEDEVLRLDLGLRDWFRQMG